MSEPVIKLAAIARPGDTLVIGIDYRMDDDEYSNLIEGWKRHVGDDIHVVIVENATSIVVVRPTGDEEEFEKEFPVSLDEALTGQGDGGVVQ